MQFPFKPQHTWHRAGGKITEITAIGHLIDKPQDGYSKDYWFYIGTIEWEPGKESTGHIYPYNLCTDEGDAVGWKEINDLSEAMMKYLNERGSWFREGPHQGWYATDRKTKKA